MTDSPVYRFTKHHKFTIWADEWELHSSDKNGHTFTKVGDENNIPVVFTHHDIHSMLSSGVMTAWHESAPANIRKELGHAHLTDLPDDQLAILYWKRDWCVALLDWRRTYHRGSLTEKQLSIFISENENSINDAFAARQGHEPRCGKPILGFHSPSPSQLRRWFQRFQQADYQEIGLYPRRRKSGNRSSRIDPDSHVFALKYVREYQNRKKPTVEMQYKAYKNALDEENNRLIAAGSTPLKQISVRTFYERVRGLNQFQVTYAREGEQAALKKYGYTSGGLNIERPLQRVEIDEWNAHLQTILVHAGAWETMSPKARACADRVRVWFSAAIDTRTRCVLALKLLSGAPSEASAISTIEMIVSDKTNLAMAVGAECKWDQYGSPEGIVTDHGAPYVGERTRSVMSDLGIEAMRPPAGRPWLRGTVEGLFGNFQRHFIRYFPGQTFSNILEKGDYDAEGNACVTVDELNRAFIRYVVDAYHNTPHSGLAGKTPRESWYELTNRYGVLPPPPPDKRRHIFGKTHELRIGTKGIQYQYLHYQSEALQTLRSTVRQTPVRVKVDEHDISKISVWANTGWLTVPHSLENADLAGVSLWHWQKARECLEKDIQARRDPTTPDLVNTTLSATRSIGTAAAIRAKLADHEYSPEMEKRADHAYSLLSAFSRPLVPVEDFLAMPEPGHSTPTAGTPSSAMMGGPDVEVDDVDTVMPMREGWDIED